MTLNDYFFRDYPTFISFSTTIFLRMLDHPEPIHINVGSLTYKNAFGTFKLNEKKWIDDLKHRTLVTDRGVTTIVKY